VVFWREVRDLFGERYKKSKTLSLKQKPSRSMKEKKTTVREKMMQGRPLMGSHTGTATTAVCNSLTTTRFKG